MTIRGKIKTMNKEIEQNKAQYDLDNKLLKFLLYHQETFVDMNS